MMRLVTVDEAIAALKNAAMNKAVGRRVKRLRQEKEWTQAELATRAGVTTNTLRGLERGTLATRWPKIQRIAKALGRTPESLLGDDDPIKPTDALLQGLTREDLQIARLFHDATTPVRTRALALLQHPDTDIAMQLATLRAGVAQPIEAMIAQAVAQQREEDAARDRDDGKRRRVPPSGK